MSKTREALDRIKAELLRDAPPNEKQNIEAVFAVTGEVLDNLARIADAQDRIATALENGAPQVTINMAGEAGPKEPAKRG